MAIPDFLLFTVVSVVTVYLPLFLKATGYTTTQIGVLLAFFNAAGIVIPLLVTPIISRVKRLQPVLLIIAAGMAVMPLPLFRWHNVPVTSLVLIVYAAFYRSAIPVCDTMINNALGIHREKYGYVRVFGSIGFVVMSLILQHFIVMETCTKTQMTAWMCGPAVLLVLAVLTLAGSTGGTHGSTAADGTVQDHESAGAAVPFGAGFFLILFVIFMQYLGMVPANQFLSLYLTDSLKSNAEGFVWAFNALCEIPFMFFSGRLIRRYGALPLILVCTAAVTVRMAFYAFIPNLTGVLLGQALHSITFGVFYPSCIMYCTQAAGSSRRIVVSMTLFTMAGSLANVIGSSFGGWLIDAAGYRTMFCVFALIPLAGLAVYGLLRRKIQ